MSRRACCLISLILAGPALCAATRTWTGFCYPAVWSNSECWSGSVAPTPGDALDFVGPGQIYNINDYPAGTPFGPLKLHNFVIGGNEIVLNGGLTTSGRVERLNLPIRLGGSQSWVIGFDDQVLVSAGLDLNGARLDLSSPLSFVTIDSAISGTGNIVTAPSADLRVINATSSMVGNLVSFERTVEVDAANIPGANIFDQGSADILNNATVGDVTVSSGILMAGFSKQNHIGNTKNLSFIGGGNLVEAILDSTSPGGAFRLNVHGSVTLNGTALNVRADGTSFPSGTTFTLIDNDGTDAVHGTFTGLPEGAIAVGSGQAFRISYRGGTGNDVVLTVVAGPNIPVLGVWTLGALAAMLGVLAMLRLRT